MKNYTIKYVETYSGLYDIEAESYEQAVQTLEERLHEGAEQGPDVCTDSYFEPASDGVKETENCEPEGKWFYADIESLDEDFQKISLPVVVCDQCNTFFPVAYAGAGHHYCPNCGRRMAPADDAPAAVGQESQDVDVTIAVDCRFTTTIYEECVDTSSREVVLAAAEAMFSDADIGDLEVIGFRPVSIQTPDGEFVWER